jgi:hypothetical protein
MKTSIYITLLLLFASNLLIGQVKQSSTKDNATFFRMVNLDDSVITKLQAFLLDQGSYRKGAVMLVQHLLRKDSISNYKFVEGVYSFKLIGPHFDGYYFIYTKRDGVQIIKNYRLTNLLEQLITCFKRNESSFTDAEQTSYLKIIVTAADRVKPMYGDKLRIGR